MQYTKLGYKSYNSALGAFALCMLSLYEISFFTLQWMQTLKTALITYSTELSREDVGQNVVLLSAIRDGWVC